MNKCTRGFCTICKRKHHTLLHEHFSTSSLNQSTGSPNTTRPRTANQCQFQPPQRRPQGLNRNTLTQSTPHSTPTLDQSNSAQQDQLTTDHTATCNRSTITTEHLREVLLSTAIIRICNQHGQTLFARALLDSASQRNLMTKEFAQKLKCKQLSDYLKVKGVGSSESVSTVAVVPMVRPRSLKFNQFAELMKFHVLNKVTSNLPSKHVTIESLGLPTDVNLADPHFNVPGPVDLIIGAEHYHDLLVDGRIKLPGNGPTLQNTVFGWVISGAVNIDSTRIPRVIARACSGGIVSTNDLQDQLAKFWELESCHTKEAFSVEETICEQIFKKTTFRDNNGRFVVTLPKKEAVLSKIGESRSIAMKRFLGLEKRLQANPEMKALYHEFIQEFINMGHMVDVTEEIEPILTYYMPHHAVLKPESTTTRLRVVFDASCPTSTGVSLNDALMVGPVVQQDLLSIILRFRFNRIAVVADIAKMYRMVAVQISDQDLQRVLWRESPGKSIRTYKLTTVTYGTASAPYLATRCLQTLAEEGKSSHPIAAKTITEGFYVDDLLSGADSVESAQKLVLETIDLMDSAGFILRKWRSNADEALKNVPIQLKDNGTAKELDSSSATIRTLGLLWEPCTDNFLFNIPNWNTGPNVTKRTVLSDTARIFDPLGLITPVVITAKIFLQDLWKTKLAWDDELPTDMYRYWIEYRRAMADIETITIPRWIGYRYQPNEIELHGFCDASEKAYGACFYIRNIWEDGTKMVRLLTSKSRVAPIEDTKRKARKQTIPRLELASALLLSHVYNKIKNGFPTDVPAHFWTDSMIVKCWLESSPSRWQVFVGNRVSEIQHLTRGSAWSHISGAHNPADIITRGMNPAFLRDSSLWWCGPTWLIEDKSMWPPTVNITAGDMEIARQEERSSLTCSQQVVLTNEFFSLRSSLPALIRITALILRFAHNARRINRENKRFGFITQSEHDVALMKLIQLSQTESFPEERASLFEGHQVKESSRMNALNPVLLNGIIHVGGRLRNAAISTGRKHPIILDHHHPLTKLILRYYHLKYFHAGQQLLISTVRERYWPLNIRRAVRQIIHECVACFRNKPKLQDQLMADLPQERVNAAPAFLKVGVDYCGPFLMSYPGRKARPIKCFVAVFVCLTTKAIHLEIVTDLTTQAYIAALRRFIARRGKPTLIMSDNAKNFVGARREVGELSKLFCSQQFKESLIKAAMEDGVEFKFIPARSPNFGGLWEAAVKSFKTHFKKTIGLRVLRHDELETVVFQIEACLNSRPLTSLSSDPNDLEVLTPGHFLIQRPLTALAEPSLDGIPENRLLIWQKSQNFVQQIWKKWSTQYLSDLHNRTKWTRQRNNIFVGTMVLLREENLPPLKWQLGRVIEVRTGDDANVRVVTVRTKDGCYVRGISKI
ncbi:uncharacterized protein LOC129761163 [Toxorhynchites rutilus septentrionalis]|uniref:uncharacterized protein LOC129761163 n=1 Tax=Toxorhynchites rutilus septentrionalis TaxID=329112 RepID=UPI00247B0722|nr:uncharacterized protein LOC129761163 [Toxorhynchites rutilus septentrionalis]